MGPLGLLRTAKGDCFGICCRCEGWAARVAEVRQELRLSSGGGGCWEVAGEGRGRRTEGAGAGVRGFVKRVCVRQGKGQARLQPRAERECTREGAAAARPEGAACRCPCPRRG